MIFGPTLFLLQIVCIHKAVEMKGSFMAKVIFQLSSVIYFNFSIFNDLNLKKLAEIVGNETCVCFKSVPALYCTKSSPTHFPTGTTGNLHSRSHLRTRRRPTKCRSVPADAGAVKGD